VSRVSGRSALCFTGLVPYNPFSSVSVVKDTDPVAMQGKLPIRRWLPSTSTMICCHVGDGELFGCYDCMRVCCDILCVRCAYCIRQSWLVVVADGT